MPRKERHAKPQKPQNTRRALTADIQRCVAEFERVAGIAGQVFSFFDVDDDNPAWSLTGGADDATLRVNGPIHYYFVDVEAVVAALDELEPTSLKVLINSPGGIVTDGMALYEDLRARAREGCDITTETRGVVASAASLVYTAGDTRNITEGSSVMIHDAHATFFLSGGMSEIKDRFRKIMNQMEHYESVLARNMASRTGNSLPQVQAWMAEELWMNAEDALDKGFATAIIADKSDTEGGAEDEEVDTEMTAGVLERALAGIDLKKREGQ